MEIENNTWELKIRFGLWCWASVEERAKKEAVKRISDCETHLKSLEAKIVNEYLFF